MSGNSWVTLATNDSYSLGALVLACSLKRTGTVHSLTVLVTPGVSSSMRNQLAAVFNVVQEVNILDSKDEKNLALLTRPELGITFTKIHCWRLTQFSKCVFLDADVLVLRNCDELFEREELSAAPDVGWPDCFNSGVFVYRPSIETYNAIINLALSQGSFDGGDQGLLNQYFSDWATKDISRHLPFIYNMCSSATYSYLPAFKQFGQDVKIVHFIGSSKPWLQYLDSETRQVRPTLGSEHLQALLQLWWDIFCNDIHSKLSPDMAGLAGALSQLTLGVARSPEQIALEEHLRKQAWEHGNIDYMGRDSFDNIWQKICQTLAEPLPDTLPEICELPSQVSSVVIDTISEEVTSGGVSHMPSQLPHSFASENKEIGNITLPCTPSLPDVKMDVGSDTTLGDVSSLELKDSPVTTEKVPNIINIDSKIPETLDSGDVSALGNVSLSNIVPDTVVSSNIIPTAVNVTVDASEMSNILSPDTEISEHGEICVPASSSPITTSTLSDPLPCNVGDISGGGIGSLVSSELPTESSDLKISESEVITDTSPVNIDSLSSKLTDIVEKGSSSASEVDSVPVPQEEAIKSLSNVSDLHLSSDNAIQTKSSSLASKINEPSSVLIDKTLVIATEIDKRTEPEITDLPQKAIPNVPDSPNYPLSSEIMDKTLTPCDSSTEPEISSTKQDSSVTIPESSDQQCSPETIDKTLPQCDFVTKPETPCSEQDSLLNISKPSDQQCSSEISNQISITNDTLLQPNIHCSQQANVPDSSDIPSSLEITGEIPIGSDTTSKPSTPSTQQDVSTNVPGPTATVSKLPLDPKDDSEKLPLSKILSDLEIPEEDNKNRNVETVESVQSVSVIEPTPPTSPLDSVPQTTASDDSNILSIDSSIPETPPVGSQTTPVSQDQSNLSSASIISAVPESSMSSETSQTVEPQAPIPPKRRHRPSQKAQKGKK